MIGSHSVGPIRGIRTSRWREVAGIAGWTAAAVLGGAAVAYLVAEGLWYLALALLLAVPAMVLVLRYPLATIAVWLVVTPFVTETESAAVRQVFWMVHRALPLTALLVIVLGSISRVDDRPLARLGWPELMMAGYLVASLLSIAYASDERVAIATLLYDRVVVPMCLYLIVRLLKPNDGSVRRLLPVALLVLIVQSAIGILSWVAPNALPSDWLGHASERTAGTFHDPDVFGTTVLVCGVLLLNGGLSAARRPRDRIWPLLAFIWALLMVFLTFSRGNWLAGLLVLAGALYVHRRQAAAMIGLAALVLLALLASGMLETQVEFAQERLRSEDAQESALARLPVAAAAVRMFEAQPLVGWGYGNFDRYSRPYQTRVGDVVSSEKPHASHNLFLTILSEQGIVGSVLFIGPMLVWVIRSRRSWPNMLIHHRTLVAVLWLAILAYVVVNNFSVMKSPFGLGLWWLSLGLVASLVDRSRPRAARGRERRRT